MLPKQSCILAEFLLFLLRGVPFCYHSWSLSHAILQDSSLTDCHDVCLRGFNGHSGYRLVNRLLSPVLFGTLLLGKGQLMTSQSHRNVRLGPGHLVRLLSQPPLLVNQNIHFPAFAGEVNRKYVSPRARGDLEYPNVKDVLAMDR